MFNLSKIFVSIFGIGYFPLAPGTVGSLFSIIFFYLFLKYISLSILILIFLILCIISLKLISIYSRFNNTHDSKIIIIDEFIGIFFIFIFCKNLEMINDIKTYFLIFVLFRLFDIIKFFPANWVDKNIQNSFGVILDDIVAGIYCIIILYFLNGLF